MSVVDCKPLIIFRIKYKQIWNKKSIIKFAIKLLYLSGEHNDMIQNAHQIGIPSHNLWYIMSCYNENNIVWS